MTATYTKSLSGDFSGNLNITQLFNQIENSEIVPSCVTIKNKSDDVDIIFVSSLSSGEEAILDNIVSNYIIDNSKPYNNFLTLTPNKTKITSNSSYSNIYTFKYGGSIKTGLIDYIEIISYTDSNTDSYDIRVVDQNSAIVLASANFTNNKPEICDLGTISNIPEHETILEIQGKQNGEKKKNIYIESINVYYDN